ncbi:MAG: glycoside hydrolase family 75 protein [Candidatus Melainabacteria bacterium]|nr:glycoside hydrolase family 75 protein [Candidatus Melainabacteria bacterium]
MSTNVTGKPGTVNDDTAVVRDQPNFYQFSGDQSAFVADERPNSLDYYRFSGDGADKTSQPRPEALRQNTGDTPADLARAALESPSATAQDKLRAVEKLLSTGVDKLEITDKDGQKRQLRLELDMSCGKPLVHAFTNEGGKERVLLRAVSNGDGTYKQQRGKGGREVGFYGDWWSSNMADKTNFVDNKQISRGDRYKPETRTDGLYMPRRIEQVRRDQPTEFDRFQPRTYPYQNDSILPIPNITDMTNGSTDQAALNQAFDQAKNGMFNGRRPVYFKAGMTIDADGSPRARQIDPTGQTQTSLRYPDGRSVNAETVPYFVLPGGKYKHLGISLGDIAAVRYNGKVAFAVFADVGPRHKLGEGSIALAQELGIPASPRTGGVRSGVEYLVFPGSGDRTPGDPRRNFYAGAQMLRGAQGDKRLYV